MFMFRKHWPKFIPILLVLFILIAGTIYRGIFRAPLNKNVVARFPHYTIKELDGQYYFRANQTGSGNWGTYSSSLAHYPERFIFTSAQEMQNYLLGGKLTEDQVRYIYYATSAIDWEYDLYICDPVHIFHPVFEKELYTSTVEWTPLSYIYTLRGSVGNTASIKLTICGSKENYETTVENIYNYHLEFHKDYLDHVENDAAGATVHHYKGTQLSQIRAYPLQCSSGTITVVERYYDNSAVPESIAFFGYHNGAHFVGKCDTQFIKTYEANYREILQSLEIFPHSTAES